MKLATRSPDHRRPRIHWSQSCSILPVEARRVLDNLKRASPTGWQGEAVVLREGDILNPEDFVRHFATWNRSFIWLPMDGWWMDH